MHQNLAEIEASSVLAKEATVVAIPTNPLLSTDSRLNNLDATISSRLATSGYIAPANSDISAIKSVSVDNVSLVNVIIKNGIVTFNPSLAKSVVGLSLLDHGVLSIDYQRSKIYFQSFDKTIS